MNVLLFISFVRANRRVILKLIILCSPAEASSPNLRKQIEAGTSTPGRVREIRRISRKYDGAVPSKRLLKFVVFPFVMRYEFEDRGETTIVDTKQLDYKAIWDALRLRNSQREGANRIIDLYNSADFNDRILILTACSWMKPYDREAQRHQADHYRTRLELERAAQDNGLVRKLVHQGVLELHPKWKHHLATRREEEGRIVIGPGHERHPQAPYRLNVGLLHELESSPLEEV